MKDDGESSSVWLKFCLNLWKINIWWGYRSSELSLLSPPYVKEPPLPPSQAPVWKMKDLATGAVEVSPTLPGTAFTFWAPRIPASFIWALSNSIFWRHIWKWLLLMELPFPLHLLRITSKIQLNYLFWLFLHNIWPRSRAVVDSFRAFLFVEIFKTINWFLCWRKSCLLLVSGLFIFSAQLVSLGGSRAAHGARIPGVPLLILAPPDHPSNY